MLAAALGLSACGGSSSGAQVASIGSSATPSAGSSAKSTADLEAELDTYVECLRKQGANIPDPTVNAQGQVSFGRPQSGQTINMDKLQAAQKVCGPLPAGLTSPLSQVSDPKFQDAALKFAQCLRGKGVNAKDPDFSQVATGAGGNPFGSLNVNDPKVSAAVASCQHVFADAGVDLGGGS